MEGTLPQLLFLDSEPYTDMRVLYPSMLDAATIVAMMNELIRGVKLTCLWENAVDGFLCAEYPPKALFYTFFISIPPG